MQPLTPQQKGSVKWVLSSIPNADAERDHFYPTPPEGITRLLARETFQGNIWECACGDGSMSRTLEAAGYSVLSTDLVDRGYGRGGIDFLLDYQTTADNIVTNPPFKLAQEFVEHGLSRARHKVAILARLAWLEGKARRPFFESTPLARVWVFSGRLHMQRSRAATKTDAGGMIAFAWFVWDRLHFGPPMVGWLP